MNILLIWTVAIIALCTVWYFRGHLFGVCLGICLLADFVWEGIRKGIDRVRAKLGHPAQVDERYWGYYEDKEDIFNN